LHPYILGKGNGETNDVTKKASVFKQPDEVVDVPKERLLHLAL
jgi:hypothetical protein